MSEALHVAAGVADLVDELADPKSKRRWLVLGLLFSITVINFVDRQTLSVLAPVIKLAMHLSNESYGRIVAALQFGMMTGEFPMGYLMDRWGTRVGMSLAALWWSAATGAQVFTRTGTTFGLTRFWMGTGECGNFSGGVKAVTHNFGAKERTLAIGIFNSGSMVGATIATPLVVYLMYRFGFRTAFLVPACMGLIWVPFWWLANRGEPKHTYRRNADQESSWKLLRSSSAWAVIMCRFFNGPVQQFYWYWMPSYLFGVRHLSMVEIGILGWVPFLMGDCGGIAGGWVAGRLYARGVSVRNVRRMTLWGSSLVCLASLAVPHINHAGVALVMIGVALMADTFYSANMYGAITDLFPMAEVGRVTGLTGIAGGLSGLLFPLLTGYLIDHASYRPVFFMVAFMPAIATLCLFTLGRKYRTAALNTPRVAVQA